jgi:hypothetical protein
MSGRGQGVVDSDNDGVADGVPTGLDTLAWTNIANKNIDRYWAHLILAIGVIVWVCTVFFLEMRVYIKIRQDYLTSAEHRLRASATTILINNVPLKWLSENALRGLFDVFPGGIRNVWLNRDLSTLLEKIELRDSIHRQLESAETELVKMAKRKQLKQRKKDEKKARRSTHGKAPTKAELEQRRKREDAEARKLAESGQGSCAGAHDEVPRDVSQVVEEVKQEERQRRLSRQVTPEDEVPQNRAFGFGILGEGISKVGQGIGRFGQGVESGVATTNGFTRITSASRDGPRATTPLGRPSADNRRVQALRDHETRLGTSGGPEDEPSHPRVHSRQDSILSQNSWQVNNSRFDTNAHGNTVRKMSDLKVMYDESPRKWYHFWKPPPGGYLSPIPQVSEEEEYPFAYKPTNKTFGQKLMAAIGMGSDDLPTLEYGKASYSGAAYDEERDKDAVWRQYLKPKHRPTHRLPRWGFPNWLAWLTFGKKVDTIYWCRTELARLNLEIRTDQAHPERYPLMNSAFIQFNEQVSAHMACQSVMHHLPKQMAPRLNEVSPRDVIWSNMSMKWWDEWARTAGVTALIVTMIIFWSFPVAATAALGNIDSLAALPGLTWLEEDGPARKIATGIAGILPPAILALLLVLIPIILDLFAHFKGAKTGAQKEEFVQKFFFAFLFVQVFLVVTIASFFVTTIPNFVNNLSKLANAEEVLEILAQNLPASSNYFFSYMLLQGMSVSSGALLQIGTLIVWYIIARIIDSTARNKWQRNTQLNSVKWGHMFPIYTNFGCIALIYSVIAPLISIFAIITFSLLWVAQKYCLVYVVRAGVDTGGLLYQRAINQLFTGLYVMELCLVGLFIIQANTEAAGSTARAVIMFVCLLLTILFQVLMNRNFSPLANYLPITIEDEAAIRDRVFEEEQRRRFGAAEDTEVDGDEEKPPNMSLDGHSYTGREDDEIELQGLPRKPTKRSNFNPMKDVANLAMRGGRGLRDLTVNKVEGAAPVKSAAAFRKAQRQKDLEAQRAIGDALYGGVADEIEDLMPEERNALIIDAFKHHALRARQPTVWIPHDDIGVSEDEIRLTREYTDNLHISNEGTALDSKVRVVYGLNPPDFSEVDLIDL